MTKEIRQISKEELLPLLFEYHYSTAMPRHTKYYLGYYINDRLVGGMTLGWGTQPLKTIQKFFPELGTNDYFEIGKMAMLDEMPRNSESEMLSLIIKWIRRNLDIKYLFTWADGIEGKPGYVYQASNFYYGGFIWTDVYMKPDGTKLHPRAAKLLLQENAIYKNKERLFWLTQDFCEHKGIRRYKGKQFRYIYPISPRDKIDSKIRLERKNYPKDKDLEWKVQTSNGYISTEKPNFTKIIKEVNMVGSLF